MSDPTLQTSQMQDWLGRIRRGDRAAHEELIRATCGRLERLASKMLNNFAHLRPMADNARAMDDLNAILASREPLYAKADLTLDTAGKTAAQSARDLAALIGASTQEVERRYG